MVRKVAEWPRATWWRPVRLATLLAPFLTAAVLSAVRTASNSATSVLVLVVWVVAAAGAEGNLPSAPVVDVVARQSPEVHVADSCCDLEGPVRDARIAVADGHDDHLSRVPKQRILLARVFTIDPPVPIRSKSSQVSAAPGREAVQHNKAGSSMS